jgi:hypothetical protein
MNRLRLSLTLIALLVTAGAAAGQKPFVPAGPAVLEYESVSGGNTFRCVFRIQAVAPDLRVEWEEDFKLGAFIVPAQVLEKSREFLRRSALANGREVVMKAPVLVLGRELFDAVARGEKALLKIQGVEGWLQKDSLKVCEVDKLSLPGLVCLDNIGRTYVFQDCREFPLLLEYQTPHYHERLARTFEGPKVIFRWFKSKPAK